MPSALRNARKAGVSSGAAHVPATDGALVVIDARMGVDVVQAGCGFGISHFLRVGYAAHSRDLLVSPVGLASTRRLPTRRRGRAGSRPARLH